MLKRHLLPAGGALLKTVARIGLITGLLAGSAGLVQASEEEGHVPPYRYQHLDWSFSGFLGTYDRQELRRGLKVYREACSSCHAMKYLYYRNLVQPGGPELPVKQVKAMAAEETIEDGPNAEGEMFERPRKLSDPLPRAEPQRFAGALPPDLSVIAKARSIHAHHPWFAAPFVWVRDIISGYQEAGANYVYSVLTGFDEPPARFKVGEDLHYNAAFPGHNIAMPPPLSEDGVEFDDGTKATIANQARAVTAFLMWAAEPHLDTRKQIGFKVLIYLLLLAGLLYLIKRKIWANVKH